ncbi:MAG: hypothetical protein KC996_00530 [Phycisphaerales bacterium]|nr:hypothetical protein [Phycisphaerales bacterium]
MMFRSLAAVIPILAIILAGCSTPWKDHYTGAPIGHYERTDDVEIREVPWQRVDEALRYIDEQRAASDIHWSEWSRDDKFEEQGVLLRALQISGDPRDIIVLGRNVFRSTDDLSPQDGSLAKFAQSIGADYAVWSAHYVGKADKVVQEPVHRSGISIGVHGGHGHHGHTIGGWDETVYVPVVVEADEYAWVVYYLRYRD